jgi:hypothetical protein
MPSPRWHASSRSALLAARARLTIGARTAIGAVGGAPPRWFG